MTFENLNASWSEVEVWTLKVVWSKLWFYLVMPNNWFFTLVYLGNFETAEENCLQWCFCIKHYGISWNPYCESDNIIALKVTLYYHFKY